MRLILLLAVATLLVGCEDIKVTMFEGSNNSGAIVQDGGGGYDVTSVQGVWTWNCFHGAIAGAVNEYSMITATVTANSMTISEHVYANDPTCSDNTKKFKINTYVDSIVFDANPYQVDDLYNALGNPALTYYATAADLILTSETTAILAVPFPGAGGLTAVQVANNDGWCGIGLWVDGVAQDVSATGCSAGGGTRYSFLTVQGGKLYLGAPGPVCGPAGTCDGSAAGKRATSLDASFGEDI